MQTQRESVRRGFSLYVPLPFAYLELYTDNVSYIRVTNALYLRLTSTGLYGYVYPYRIHARSSDCHYRATRRSRSCRRPRTYAPSTSTLANAVRPSATIKTLHNIDSFQRSIT